MDRLKSGVGDKLWSTSSTSKGGYSKQFKVPIQRTDYRNSGTGASSGGGGRGVSVGSGGEMSQNAAYLAYLQEIERRQQKAAQDAYDRNVASMQGAFAQRGQMLKDNLDYTLKNLQTDYNASRDSVNNDAAKSFQEAYINKMLSRKNLAQNMSAQGLSGGASETTMAGMENNYGNARNNIQTTANENLGDLENLYDRNRNSAYQAYNDQLAQDALAQAQYMIQFENDRQNALTAAYESQMSKLLSLDPSYITGLAGLVSDQQAYTPTATTVSNPVSKVSTQQGSAADLSGIGAPRYALKLAQQMAARGSGADDIINTLARNSVNSNAIVQILSQLGYSA